MRPPHEGIIALLRHHGVEFEKIEHEPVHTCEEAATVRGLSLEQGAKSLLFKTKVGFVLVVVPGDKRVDSRSLKKILGVKDARFASPEEVEELMVCKIGSCYPFGNVAGLRTLADRSFDRYETV